MARMIKTIIWIQFQFLQQLFRIYPLAWFLYQSNVPTEFISRYMLDSLQGRNLAVAHKTLVIPALRITSNSSWFYPPGAHGINTVSYIRQTCAGDFASKTSINITYDATERNFVSENDGTMWRLPEHVILLKKLLRLTMVLPTKMLVHQKPLSLRR